MSEFFTSIFEALQQPEPEAKCALVQAIAMPHAADLQSASPFAPILEQPGQPEKPGLIAPQQVPKRSLHTQEGHAALIHAITHIEFNAINLALDAAWRFRDLPLDFYCDWLRVAQEEAQHFQLLREHLRTLGFDYGDFDAHSGLWDMARRTAHDPLVRMALVPRVLEARGLDVTPGMRKKLVQHGDLRAAEILEIIERDEIGHVAIGNRWYGYLCQQRGVDPLQTFQRLLQEYNAPDFPPPFHLEARRAAGFSPAELALLGIANAVR